METIKTILDHVLKRRSLDKKLQRYRAFELWEGAVGPRVARHTQPKRFQDHTLWVSVDNSVWMQQLQFLEAQIKEKLNQLLGTHEVEKIRFQIGEIAAVQEASGATEPPAWEHIDVGDRLRDVIEKEVSVLKDEGLKEQMKRLFEKNAQLHAFGRKNRKQGEGVE
jgi:hypothetical protein